LSRELCGRVLREGYCPHARRGCFESRNSLTRIRQPQGLPNRGDRPARCDHLAVEARQVRCRDRVVDLVDAHRARRERFVGVLLGVIGVPVSEHQRTVGEPGRDVQLAIDGPEHISQRRVRSVKEYPACRQLRLDQGIDAKPGREAHRDVAERDAFRDDRQPAVKNGGLRVAGFLVVRWRVGDWAEHGDLEAPDRSGCDKPLRRPWLIRLFGGSLAPSAVEDLPRRRSGATSAEGEDDQQEGRAHRCLEPEDGPVYRVGADESSLRKPITALVRGHTDSRRRAKGRACVTRASGEGPRPPVESSVIPQCACALGLRTVSSPDSLSLETPDPKVPMNALLLVLALAAAPDVGDEIVVGWGRMVLVRDSDGAFLVTHVDPCGVEGVPVGARLVRVVAPPPKKPELGGDLIGKSTHDVKEALSGPDGESVTLELDIEGTRRQVTVRRIPPMEQGACVQRMDKQAIEGALVRLADLRRAELPEPEFKLDHQPAAAWVGTGDVVPESHTGYSPNWITLRTRGRFRCSEGPPATLEVVDGLGRRHVDLLTAERELDLYLWRVKEAVAACTKEETALDSVPLELTLCCRGMPLQKSERVEPLALKCTGPRPSRDRDFRDMQVWAESGEVVLGEESSLVIRAQDSALSPNPRQVQLVQLDAAGHPVKTHGKPWRPALRERPEPLSIQVRPLDPTPLRFAQQAEYPDGSMLLGRVLEIPVRTRAEHEATSRASRAESEQDFALMQQISEWKNPCGERERFVAWLKAQPGVKSVVAEGADISYVSASGLPHIISCHEH